MSFINAGIELNHLFMLRMRECEPCVHSAIKNVLSTFVALLHTSFLQVVMAWINTCPESSTWSTLVEALNEVGHRKTAQEVAERRGMVNTEPRNVYGF